MHTRCVGLALFVLLAGLAGSAAAQPVGTFRWQLQPFCNVITVAITQNGAVYRLEGTDDQCGNGADAASVTGTAFPNADGTIGFGLNIVTAPGGRPVHVDAEINLGTFGGTWRDSTGGTGTFALTPGAGNGGNARPLPPPTAAALPSTLILRQDGGVVAGGTQGSGAIPASGSGSRMMWYPAKSAFRAGKADGLEWDDINIGAYTVALGWGTRATGEADTALGYFSVATGGASIAMGASSLASGNAAMATGASSVASGDTSTAMGQRSTASGVASTALGNTTTAAGAASLAGGFQSSAEGLRSLAFGNEARATGAGAIALGNRPIAARGSFVFADDTGTASTLPSLTNQFVVRAAGGALFYSNAAMTLGVQLAANGTQWSSLSDVRKKHEFRELDADDVLNRIAAMPVSEWSYKAQDASIRHIGPTAQDFHAAFGLGEDPLRIGTLDADGVALAGVKALEARTHGLPDRLRALEIDIAHLRAELEAARVRVAALVDANSAWQARLARLEQLLGQQ